MPQYRIWSWGWGREAGAGRVGYVLLPGVVVGCGYCRLAAQPGISLVDSLARESSEAALSAASQARLSASVGSQGGSVQDSGHDAAVCASWFDESINVGASSSSAEPISRPLAEPAHCVSFVEIPSLDDDDRESVVLEKASPSEGMRSALRLLFQLCLSAVA